jgi:hypothetical protein
MHLLDNYAQSFLAVNQERSDTQKEQFKVTTVSLVNDKFNITVQNTGPIPLNITRLWVQNTTTTNWVAKYQTGYTVPPGATIGNIGTNIPLNVRSTNSYDVKLVTGRGNIEEFDVGSSSNAPLQMQIFVLPNTVPSGFTTTVLLGVTNNMSNTATLANITPTLSVISLGASASLVSGPQPAIYNALQYGNTAYFQWTYSITGNTGASVEFNATIQNAYPKNYVLSTVTVDTVPTAGQSQTSLQSRGFSALGFLILHHETTSALNGYEMYSASPDGTGTAIALDTTNPIFYTNNDTVTINIPAGPWTSSFRYLSSPIPSTIGTNPSMIFHFEDGFSATTAKDSTGNTGGLTLGTGSSKPVWASTNGVNGSGAFAFSGGQYMDSSISSSFNNIGTQATTSGWFKTSSASRQVILRMGSSGDSSPFYEVGLDTGGNAGRVLFRYDDNTNGNIDGLCESPASKNYADGNWHHFVAEKTGNGGICALYLDGSLSFQNTGTSCSGCTFASISTSNKWVVGRDDSQSGKNYFNGNVDDILHWNSININQAQITDLYKTNYGNAAHKLNFILDIVDQNGNFIQHVNTTSISNNPVPFGDSFGTFSNPGNSAWLQYNVTFNMPSVTLGSNQRLKLEPMFINQAGNGQLSMKLEIDNISIGGISALNSLLEIPLPDQPLPGYYTYQSGEDGNVNLYNAGPNPAWVTGNTRVVFENYQGTQAYASWVCGFNGFPQSVSADSPLIGVGSSEQICYTMPMTQPGTDKSSGGNPITPGNYRMYIYINGYDDTGNIVVATQYIGPVKVT